MSSFKLTDFKNTSLEVKGMTCDKCADSIERLIMSQNGVKMVSVNYLLKLANIEYNPEFISLSEIKSKVQSLGYDLNIEVSKANKID